MTHEERWVIVKNFYEKTYFIKFKTPLKEEDTMILYKRMKTLEMDLADFYAKHGYLAENYIARKQRSEGVGFEPT